jgi:membrane protein YqaA with SNARE-associated domain
MDMQAILISNNVIQNLHLYHWRNGYSSSTVLNLGSMLNWRLGYIGGSVLQRLLDHPKKIRLKSLHSFAVPTKPNC